MSSHIYAIKFVCNLVVLILNTVITKCLSKLLRYFCVDLDFLCSLVSSILFRRTSLLSNRCSNKPNNLLANCSQHLLGSSIFFSSKLFTYSMLPSNKEKKIAVIVYKLQDLRTGPSKTATAVTTVSKLNRV